MKALILSNCSAVEYQGSGYVIVNTRDSLTSLGYDVEVIQPSDIAFFPTIWPGRALVYRIIMGMAIWVWLNRRNISKYELIIFYGAESFLALYILKRILNVRMPVLLHSNGLELHVGYRLKSLDCQDKTKKWFHRDLSVFFSYCYTTVDAIITVSQFDRDFAVEHLQIPSENVYYNEPALPAIFFEYSGIDIVSKKKIITYCGTWIRRKGAAIIESAIPDILRKYPAYTFRIIGVGKAFKPEEHFPSDVLDRIEVFPSVESKDQMVQLYAESSICLLPSFYESFGLVVAEAMFCKCAVVTGFTGFAASLINKEEAITLHEPDSIRVAEALEELITNTALRNRMAINARERTQGLTWKNYTQRLHSIISAIHNKGNQVRLMNRI